ncbi:MAG: NERD domain-containing protein [Frankiaceae bacterium]|nr:NERD domain-containing protein [Frankiaceae bacterium]
MKVLALRRPDTCATCSAELAVGVRACWDAATKSVRCLSCSEQPTEAPAPDICEQRAGGSAQREYERRSGRREQRIRADHPRLGRLILALSEEPASTRVWAQGAAGERAVGAVLDEIAGEYAVVLHDRLQRRSDGRATRANLDHMAVAATGVWVIDAKTHQGSLEVRRSGGWFSPTVEQLVIRGRDQTHLVHGVQKQVASVAAELETVGAAVPVNGALCFVGTELPWFGSSSIADVRIVGRRGLAKLLKAEGPFDEHERNAVGEYLAARFEPASL